METKKINSNHHIANVTCIACGHKGKITILCDKNVTDIERDMAYGQRVMLVTTPDADMKENKDYILEGGFGIAYRRRRFNVDKFNEISIRNSRVSGAKTEKQKILDGKCKSRLFIYEFKDAWVVCTLEDISDSLKNDSGYVQPNSNGTTSAYYISLSKIRHTLLKKEPAKAE